MPPSHPHSKPTATALPELPDEERKNTKTTRRHNGIQPAPIQMAIIDSNLLACMGLMHILKKFIPFAQVKIYHAHEELMADDPESFAHFFVSSRIYFEHTRFFRRRAYRTIVLINGENLPPMPGILTLNVSQSEQDLITDLLQMHSQGHGTGPHRPRQQPMETATRPRNNDDPTAETQPLTAREIEVITLLGKGYINKEIADRLNIGLTTVITHRKNIMSKINAHSLSDVIIYAVMNGHLDLGE